MEDCGSLVQGTLLQLEDIQGSRRQAAEQSSERTKGSIDYVRLTQSKTYQKQRRDKALPSQKSAEPPGLLPTELRAQDLYPCPLKLLKQW